jgi:hypothetical protein
MLGKRTGIGAAVAGLVLCGLAAPADAVILNFSGNVTSCTPTCDSFAFLGTGSLLVGTIEFDGAAIADGTWTGGDVLGLSFSVFDPAVAHHGPSIPPDPVLDNPFTLDPTADGGGLTVANGQSITNPRGTWPPCVPPNQGPGCVIVSQGTYNGTSLNGGVMDLWVTQGLLANNGAVIHLDFTTGSFNVNIFEGLIFVSGGTFTNTKTPNPKIALSGKQIAGTLGKCQNVTTGQTVNVPLSGPNLPCEARGLATSPFDELNIIMNGTAQSSAQLGGKMNGSTVTSVRCKNVTTTQQVGATPPPGGTQWNCVARGLVVTPGDSVQMTVKGNALH